MSKRTLIAILLVGWTGAAVAGGAGSEALKAASLSDVKIDDGFWTPRLEINQKVGVRHAFERCDQTGALSNFDKAAGVVEGSSSAARPRFQPKRAR